MEQSVLHVSSRRDTGSGAAHRLRRDRRIPAVLYGHRSPEAISLDEHEFRASVGSAQYGSQMVRVELDGQDIGMALVKAVQTRPLEQSILSVDLQRVSRDESVQISVSVILVGEPAGLRRGGVLEQNLHAVMLRCRADAIPAEVTVDISKLQLGEAIRAAEVVCPADCELLQNPDDPVAVLLAPTVPVEEEPVTVDESAGPELTGEKQQDDFPSET